MANKISTEEFIRKAQEVHGDKYDYSETIYLNAKIKVIINCSSHNVFFQTPDNHLKGKGCPKCAGKKWDTEDFIKYSVLKHGNKYDYSKTNYLNKRKPVVIICENHGEFLQNPFVHISGSGCPKCVGKNKTFNELVSEATKVHGNKYEYIEYFIKKEINGKSRGFLKIRCTKHENIWNATIDSHINKATGCNICSRELVAANQRSDINEIKSKIEKIHPDYIVPINQTYFNQHTNLIYYCKIHGKQKGRALNLINGQGCPVCGQENRNKLFRDDWNEVIKKIENKHKNYIVYREQRFENHHSPIVYKCSIHGDKVSTANSLLSKGTGCNECGKYKRAESQKSNWVEVVNKIHSINKNIIIDVNQHYENTNSPVIYFCKKHGKHYATPSKLLMGRGCPKCANESRNNYSDTAWCLLCGDRDAKLYWIKMKYKNDEWFKIGKTFQSIKNRWWELKKIGIEYEVLKVIIGTPEYICKLERRVHKFYKNKHYVPQVNFGGHLTECLK